MTETAPTAIEADVRLPQRRWRPQARWPVLLASLLLHVVLAGVLYPGGGAPLEAPAPLFIVDVVLRAPGAPALPKGVNAGAPAPPETAAAGVPAVAAIAPSAPTVVSQPSPTAANAAPTVTSPATSARVAVAGTPAASAASPVAITAAAPSPLTAAKAPTVASAPAPVTAAASKPSTIATGSASAAMSAAPATVSQATSAQATAVVPSAVAVAAPKAVPATATAPNAVRTAQRSASFVAAAPAPSAERTAPSVGPPPSVQAGTAPVLAPDPMRTLQAARPALPPPPLPPRKPPSLLAQERNPRIVRENARIVGAPLPLIDDIPPSGALAGPGAREAEAAAQSGGRVAGAQKRRIAKRAAATGGEGRAGGQAAAGITTPADYRGASFWNSPPPYPFQARRRGLEGQVVVRVQVSPAGWAKSVAVRRSSGHRVLDRAALEAVRDWRFKPAARAGKPIDGEVDVPVVFRLNQ